MDFIVVDKDKLRVNRLIEWLIYMLGYTIVFIFVTSFFESIYINTNYFYIFAFLTVLIIYILNKTIKPMLVTLTIPITGLTLGLFYPFINLFILQITSWIMGRHFKMHNFYIALFVAILLSVMNLIMEGIIIKPMIKRFKTNG